MMMPQMYNLNEETIHLYKDCFDKNGSLKSLEIIRWQFLNNPIRKQYVEIAVDKKNNKTAAIYAISPVGFRINNKVEIGSQSLDTITDSEYRGKGLFIKLANNVYYKAKADKVSLVYGFPNGNSIYGFQKKLDWQILDPLPFLIKPLRSIYFTKRFSLTKFLPNLPLSFSKFRNSKDYTLEVKNEFPLEVNEIWEKFSDNIQIAVNRDKEYLDWRYIDKPNENYRIIHCYSNTKEYLGYIIYTVKDKHGGKIGYIMEFVYDLTDEKAGLFLLQKAISEIKQVNADCILAWCLQHSPNYNIFKKYNFFNMPEKLRPIELHFGARAFDESLKNLVSNRKSWYISYSDSDTV